MVDGGTTVVAMLDSIMATVASMLSNLMVDG